MSVEDRTDEERRESAERREQFWKDQYRGLKEDHEELESQFREEINRHRQFLATAGTGSFVSGLVQGQMMLRLAEVETELRRLLAFSWGIDGDDEDD